MAITNAQQYQQLVNKPANGKRPGYRGPGGYQSGQSDPSTGATGNIGGGGAPSPGDTGGEGGYNPSDNSTTQFGGGADNTGAYDDTAAKKQKAKEKAAEQRRKEKAAADKKAAEAEAKEEKKEAKAKAKKDKRLKKMRQKAFDRFQQLEEYVDPFGDETTFAGMSGEDAAKLAGYKGDLKSGFEYDKDFFRDSKTGKINDDLTKLDEDGIEQLRYDLNVGTPEYKTAFPGYDFSINPVKSNFQSGLGTLTSTGSTTKVKPNDYGLQIPTGTSLDILSGIVRPPTGLQAFNTLEEARNIGDLTGRYAGGDDSAYDDYLELIDRTNPTTGGGGGGNQQQTDPCLGPNPPAYCAVNNDPTDPATPKRNFGGLAPRFAGSIFDFTGLADGGIARAGAMDGGRMMMMANQEEDDPEGGIMDLESGRQMYFLGKLVKKASRAIKKVVKSPIGKAALMYFGGNALMGAGGGGLKSLFSSGKGLSLKNLIMGGKTLPPSMGFKSKGLLGFMKDNPYLSILGGSSILAGLSGKDEDEGEIDYGPGIDIKKYRFDPYGTLAPGIIGSNYQTGTQGRKDGGRMGYAEGSKEPVAKETMPLLDMDGKEMDLREDGGFVPLGRMERADDVPARLSKNEFVFTADAVRNAGEGDIDKGAEVMYNMMKNLESGGEVSEESQGLDGAREMFKTSQRLEEVL